MEVQGCIRCAVECEAHSRQCQSEKHIKAADASWMAASRSPAPIDSSAETRRRCAEEFNRLSAGAFEGSGAWSLRRRANVRSAKSAERRARCAKSAECGGAVGRGRLATESGDVYEGQLKGGRQHGQGTTSYGDGSTYVGSWEDGLRHGFGREEMFDGPHFEGQFALDRRNGIGIYTAANGSVYQGTFRDGRIEGHGRYDFADGHVYAGQWHSNCKNGAGRMRYPNGQVYEGQFLGDRRHGKGRLSWPSGRSYDGQWVRGHQHGSGTLTAPRGQPESGHWDMGVRAEGERSPPRVEGAAPRGVANFAVSPPGPSLMSHQLAGQQAGPPGPGKRWQQASPPSHLEGAEAHLALLRSEGTEVSLGDHMQNARHFGDDGDLFDEGDDVDSESPGGGPRHLLEAQGTSSTASSENAAQLRPGVDAKEHKVSPRGMTGEFSITTDVNIDVQDTFAGLQLQDDLTDDQQAARELTAELHAEADADIDVSKFRGAFRAASRASHAEDDIMCADAASNYSEDRAVIVDIDVSRASSDTRRHVADVDASKSEDDALDDTQWTCV